MKIHTNENNLATLKIIIAAKLANKKVELVPASISVAAFPGPCQLPWLEVDEELRFFSSNAAAQFLFPILDLYGQCQQIQEWEVTRLYPSMVAALDPKSAVDSKQLLSEAIQQIDTLLGTKAYILGDLLSAADISLWATLYPVYYNDEHRNKYLANASNLCKWYQLIANSKAVQEAVKQWGGSANIPLAQLSALGCPQMPTLLSPSGPQDNTAVATGPTPEELSFAQDCWLNGFRNLPKLLARENPILPVKGRKNVLITSALPYVNNVPHLGNIIGCVLSADIFARYCRICDYNTLFICGTDEYGTATETKALEEGITPREICDKYFAIHNEVYRWFNIGFDCFGRTSTPHQTEITQKMFKQLHSNGFVSPQTVDQLLCEKCDMFLADRFVEGTCPHAGCGYEGARGDQCDRCGKLVNATELLAPRCKQCGAAPVLKQSSHLFLELPQLEASVRNWVSAHLNDWSASARGVARAWLRDGLKARCITRDLKWGVPVPLEPYTDKVFYVWFDAPMGYLSITKRYTDQYEKWWRPDPDTHVKLYQFMAKDNVPFHTIMFPAVLIGVNQGHKLVDHVFATEYLNYEEGKFSKSRGVGVFGSDAQDTGIPADIWRFYLASIRPEGQDSSFSWLELGTRNNSELLNNVGNFCHRALSFVRASLGGVVPALPAPLPAAAARTAALVNRECAEYVVEMERGRIREALRCVLAAARLGNQHMQAEQPWALLKGAPAERSRGEQAVALCCQLAALVCVLLAPYMPDVAEALRAQLAMPRERMRIDPSNPGLIQYLPDGHKIGTPEPLFTKIEAERLMDLKKKYAGTQSDRANRENGDSGAEPTGAQSVQDLEAAVARQGEKVRQLKASTKDKAVWQPEIIALLELKKQLAAAQNSKSQPSEPVSAQKDELSAQELERAIAEQGDKVRKLKASTKDKTVWAPEVNALLDLKKKLVALQANK